MVNNRKNDSIVEREIAAFLDKHLYSDKTLFSDFMRTDGKEEQINGSDVILSTCDGVLNGVVVDEKVASRYANMGLDTFSLELSFIGRNGKRRDGWLIDSSKTTEFYLFGWVDKCDIPYNEEKRRYETDSITSNNIKVLEWALVSKSAIMSHLDSLGWSIERLGKQDERIRQNGGVKTKEFINGVSFRYSDSYIEKPINILMKKETYMSLAHCHGVIDVSNDIMDISEQVNGYDEPLRENGKVVLESSIVNDRYTEFLYGAYDIQNKEKTVTYVPIPSMEDLNAMNEDDWNIMLICGNSGGGKTTILKEVFKNITEITYDNDKCVISQFPNLSEEEVCDLLSSMGLSSVPTWLRKPKQLSNGEKARLDIAKAIYDSNGDTIVLDEFTSVVNRDVAKSMSFALQRYVRQNNLRVVIASCHFDIVEWLQPDYIFNLNHIDDNGDVELEKIVYSDDFDYKANYSVREEDILSNAMEIPT